MTTSIFSHCAGNIFKSESFVFPVSVSLDETAVKFNNATIPLIPGMTVAVKIRTDSRRVID
jgi:hemolysin D